ncbi:TonB-dependent receptor [Gimibacter soli]|uniref:TonB-dependent receptor n=1 Tax=Gimibacter soli TaxID=3024400 RepID=A0AAF0BMA0_9PROT|nr:TonB-dependent receptor [Gimibacter soli]WCL55247.1 TonB-dependent receptor [Gimibacter soli]
MLHLSRMLLASSAAIALTLPAVAQAAEGGAEDAFELEEIIVTAQKREQRLLDVPQSVSVLSSKALAAAQAERFDDYLTRLPSATFTTTQSGQTRLILRGINAGGVGATVATYVDETPYGSATGLANGAILTPDLDPFDVARVEVLRGPQGTLYGANSLGGLVKFVTVKPSTEGFEAAAKGNVESMKGGDTGYALRGAVNVPLGEKLALRASAFHRKDAGFIDDVNGNEHVNSGTMEGGRASLLFKPTDNFSVLLSANLQDLKSNGDNSFDADPATNLPLFGELMQSRLLSQNNDIKYRIYNGTVEWDLEGFTLTSATSYGKLDQTQTDDFSSLYGPILTAVFGTPLGAGLDATMGQKRFTQEFRVDSTGDGPLQWTVGGYYSEEENALGQVLYGIDAGTGEVFTGLEELILVGLDSDYKEYAGFASATYSFSEKLDLTVGARYSSNDQTNLQSTAGPLAGPATSFDGDSSDTAFTFSVAPSFKPNETTTLYARVARGYRPGGPNALPPTAPTSVPRDFAPDYTTNYEAGVKAELLERTLAVDASLFYIDWTDIQVLVQVDNFGVNSNGGKAKSQGAEFSATYSPVEGLTFTGSASYVDAKLTEDADPLTGALDGDRLPYVPKFSSSIGAEYEWPLSDTLTGSVGGTWRHTGARESGFDSTLGQRTMPSYELVDLHAGIAFENITLEAYVRNLTDARGFTALGGPSGAPMGGIAASIIRPRAFGLSLSLQY